MDRWGQYFKPDGMKGNAPATGNAQPTQSVTKASAPRVDEDEDDNEDDVAAPAVTTTAPKSAPASEAGSRASDIIAMIRNRQQS
jgi:hypothetical protein